MTAHTALLAAIEVANREALADLAAETGLTLHVQPVGAEFTFTGPITIVETPAGPRRLRGLFQDGAGAWYGDAVLAAESLFPARLDLRDHLLDRIGGTDQTAEVGVVTLSRGEHFALLAPVETIADVFDLTVSGKFPADNWARGWATLPSVSDEQAIELLANGVPV